MIRLGPVRLIITIRSRMAMSVAVLPHGEIFLAKDFLGPRKDIA
jgi:hypothetical protein